MYTNYMFDSKTVFKTRKRVFFVIDIHITHAHSKFVYL